MNDSMLEALRQDPPAAFTRELWGRLQEGQEPRHHGRRLPVRRIAASLVAAAALAGMFAIPAVRAQASSFLSLFRVAHIVGVSVDPARAEALEAVSVRTLIGNQVQVVQDPGPPTPVVSLEQAASLAGYALRTPQWLPAQARIIEMAVTGEGHVRVTGDSARLNALLDTFGITDLRAPADLDGQVATIQVPRAVMIRYEHGRTKTRFYQAPVPEVRVPDGVPLQALGEIGLRLLGVSAPEARRFAAAIDWTSTLLVPLSPNVHAVRQVAVGPHTGLGVEFIDGSPTNMVIWSAGERVYAVVSLNGMSDVLEMANSVR